VAEDTDDDSNDEEPRRGKPLPMQVSASTDSLAPTSALGVDLGASGEGSATKSGGTTPAAAGDKRRVRGVKRGREDEDEEEEEEPEDEARPAKRSGGTTSKKAATYDEVEVADEGTGGENEVDSKVYCTCRQVSYGEMIGCDAPPGMCKVEWVSENGRTISETRRAALLTLLSSTSSVLALPHRCQRHGTAPTAPSCSRTRMTQRRAGRAGKSENTMSYCATLSIYTTCYILHTHLRDEPGFCIE
jgi:hypothetical protein